MKLKIKSEENSESVNFLFPKYNRFKFQHAYIFDIEKISLVSDNKRIYIRREFACNYWSKSSMPSTFEQTFSEINIKSICHYISIYIFL